MRWGLARLRALPVCTRLIREVHAQLMRGGVRGGHLTPGELRTSQNWIGGCSPAEAVFVPPPPSELNEALGNFDNFIHDRESLPDLIHCGISHAQFETIHPFLDGNGRLGRLLITLLLCERGILRQPLLYLSYYLTTHRAQYFDRLMAIRNDGDWEGWLAFFLRGVEEVSENATGTARAILSLREQHRQAIQSNRSPSLLRLLDHLYKQPLVTVSYVQKYLDCSWVFASRQVDLLEDMGVLREITGARRNRRYRYEPYLTLFEVPLATPAGLRPNGATETPLRITPRSLRAVFREEVVERILELGTPTANAPALCSCRPDRRLSGPDREIWDCFRRVYPHGTSLPGFGTVHRHEWQKREHLPDLIAQSPQKEELRIRVTPDGDGGLLPMPE